jgi:glycosyltransferase involved in cell wall biosynthesis
MSCAHARYILSGSTRRLKVIHIVTCFWNAGDYVGRCIKSIREQTEKDYLVHLVDDASSDASHDECIKATAGDERFRIYRNEPKKYKLKSIDEIISDSTNMKDEDVVVELDGDDQFAHPEVLERVKMVYDDPRIMICNARHTFSDGSLGYSRRVNVSEVRYRPFEFLHLRTWRAGLWRGVDKRYFMDPDDPTGGYFRTAVDVAYSMPMLELAGEEAYEYLPEVMVVYNDQNPKNSHKPGSAVGGISAQNSCAIRARLLNFSNNPNFDKEKIERYIENEPRYKLGRD